MRIRRVVPMLTAIVALGAATGLQPAFAAASRADLGHASELRSFLGFESSPLYVQMADLDEAGFPDMTWGIPLSNQEAAEMHRRLEVMHAAFPLVEAAAKDPDWAGWWIDQEAGGLPVLQFAGDANAAITRVQRGITSTSTYRVRTVESSLAELEQRLETIKGTLDRLESDGIPITGVKVDIKANRLVIALDPLTDSAKKHLASKFGGDLDFEHEPVARADIDGCGSGCLPLKAGLGMVAQHDPLDVCTVGFLARRYDLNPDQLVFVTAGHCVEVGTSDGPWQHGSTTIGSSLYFSGNLVEVWYNYSDADVGLVKVASGAIPTIKNKLLADASPQQQWDIELALIDDLQAVDMIVCRMGRTTGGPQCGPILNEHGLKKSEVPGVASYWIDDVIVYGRDANGGDSGGPIFYTTGSPSSGWATLLGTHVHSQAGYVATGGKAWYSPWDRGFGQLNANFPVIDLSVCVTASCGF